jgi:hypothetical protein
MKGPKTKKPAAPFAPLERDVEPNLRKLGFVRARCVSPSVPRVAREVGRRSARRAIRFRERSDEESDSLRRSRGRRRRLRRITPTSRFV